MNKAFFEKKKKINKEYTISKLEIEAINEKKKK